VLSDHKPNNTAVSSCSMCCLTTSPTPLLWVHVLCVVWPQAQHHCCEFMICVVWPQAQHHCCDFVFYVLSDHKPNTVSSCSMCCLTTGPTPLLWVRVPCVVWLQANTTAVSSCPFVVWPQAQHHCCEFVSYVLCDKPNTIDVSLCPMCCPSTSTTPLLVP
jgi:hypothetical protein